MHITPSASWVGEKEVDFYVKKVAGRDFLDTFSPYI